MTSLAVLLLTPSMSLAAAPPLNDNYLLSTIVTQTQTTGMQPLVYQDTPDTSAATTQSDLFIPGTTSGGGGPERLTCNGSSYGNTVWYDMHPNIPGGVELIAAGFPTAIALYQWDPNTALITRRVGCQVSTSLLNDYAVPVDVLKGKRYTVQIGGLQTASGFAAGSLDFKLTFFPDHDADLIPDVIDKCPLTPGVARYGGCPPDIHPIPRFSYSAVGSGIRFALLRLDQIPGGAQVLVRCRPCGVREVRQAGRHASSVTMTAFAGQTLAAGDKLEIWVTRGPARAGNFRYGAFGSYVSYTVNLGLLGGRVLRCLMPGSLTPRRTCPPGGRRHLGRVLSASQSGWTRFRSDPISAAIP